MYVLRLNPFYTAVGACLFTWTEHARILTKGPFEFRTVDIPKTAPEAFSSYQVWSCDGHMTSLDYSGASGKGLLLDTNNLSVNGTIFDF